MPLFLDTEFSALDAHSQLISLAMVDHSGRALYVERLGLKSEDQNDWLREHVLPLLREPMNSMLEVHPENWVDNSCTYARGDNDQLAHWLGDWLAQYHSEEVWVDMGAWDWFHFAGLFGGALQLPKSVQMYPIELSTWLRASNKEFDMDRTLLAAPEGQPHHALDDAEHLRQVVAALSNTISSSTSNSHSWNTP